jgi:hypothetical protein
MATPTTAQEFRDRAAECEHMAEEATNAENHERMLYVANRWRSLADEGESEEEFPLPQPKSKARPMLNVGAPFVRAQLGNARAREATKTFPTQTFGGSASMAVSGWSAMLGSNAHVQAGTRSRSRHRPHC